MPHVSNVFVFGNKANIGGSVSRERLSLTNLLLCVGCALAH